MGMINVRVRDYLGTKCLSCLEGEYVEMFCPSGTLICCDICGDITERWMTKRQMVEHINNTFNAQEEG